MAGGEFDKDFGYLMPFLDKVAAAASEVQNQEAREELARLVDGEKERWTQIRKLLSSDGGESASPAPSPKKEKESEAVSENREEKAPPASPRSKAQSAETVSEQGEKPKVAVSEGETKSPTQPLSGEEAADQPSLQFTVGSLRPRKH